jgi:carbonic anhydrase/acetyltransferase-like protein (isoleucine patch superfamily)
MNEALILPWGGHTPVVSRTAFLARNATLIGDVTLADQSSVFYGAVLRADGGTIHLGERSNLQDNVTVHADPGMPTMIGKGVSVGHAAMLHSCIIEDNCLIGMSATVLTGAVIGTGSLVAAGAVVLEGTIIPPNSLVLGMPAKVHRELNAEQREHVRLNAEHYVEFGRLHAELP